MLSPTPKPLARRRFSGPAFLAVLLALLVSAGTSHAAAWPRGKDRVFLTLSNQVQLNDSGERDYAALFLEYGLTERLTLGLDAGRSLGRADGSVIAFLRAPLDSGAGPDRFAVELGLGSVVSDGTALLRPGLSWGRGYTANFGNGWMGVEATYAFSSNGTGLGKIDTTLGVNHAGGSLSILQLQASLPSDGEFQFAIAPSHILKVSDTVSLELGASYRPQNGAASVKFGIWLSY